MAMPVGLPPIGIVATTVSVEADDRQRVVRLVGDEGFSDRRRISRDRAAPCGERRSKCNRGRQYSDAHGAEPSRPLRAFA
jgi:hypothetical protein